MVANNVTEKSVNSESVILSFKGYLNIDVLQKLIIKSINEYQNIVNGARNYSNCNEISDKSPIYIHSINMEYTLNSEKNTVISKWMEEHNAIDFNFIDGLCIKLSFIELPEKESLLLITGYDIITDIWYIDLFCRIFKEFYEFEILNKEAESDGLVQFKEHVKWQNETICRDNFDVVYKDNNYENIHINEILYKKNNLIFNYIKEQVKFNLDFFGLKDEENIKYYILDYYMQKVPVGTIGELYIGKNDMEKYSTNNLAMLNRNNDLVIFGNKDTILDIHGRKVSLKIINDKIEVIPYIEQNNMELRKLIERLGEYFPKHMLPKYFVIPTTLSISNTSNFKKLKPNNHDELINYENYQHEEVNQSNAISKAPRKAYYPLVGMQKRLFIMNQLNKDDISYNLPIILTVEGIVNIVKLENAIKKIISRHEVFRTTFKLVNGIPVQIITEECDFKINILSIKNKDIDDIIRDLIIPFDLSKAPLLRVSYVETDKNQKILLIDMHHIISDGISMHIFAKELVDIYKGIDLRDIDVQYKDYIEWKSNNINLKQMEKLQKYWLEKTMEFTYTSLPQKHNFNNKKSSGRSKEVYFNKEEYLKINTFCKKNSITKFTYFTAILNIILMNEVGINDISIGIPVAGRDHNKVQNLIGLFLNLIIIRINIDTNKNLGEFLHVVSEQIIGALSNQEYSYEELYNIIVEKYGLKNESLFSIMLNYMPYIDDNSNQETKIGGVTFKMYKEKYCNPKYDVTFYIKENKDDILINMVYKDVFEDHTIERISEAFHNVSEVFLNNSITKIKDIEYSQVMHEDQSINIIDDYFENEEFFIND